MIMAVRVDSLEVADHQHPEIRSRRNRRPTLNRRVVRAAEIFHEPIEPRLVQDLIHPARRTGGRAAGAASWSAPTALPPLHLDDPKPSSSPSRCSSYDPRPSPTTARCEFFNGLLGREA